MTYKCPKGHQSTDSDYCSECGALIGQSKIASVEPLQGFNTNKPAAGQEICPDCGTPRVGDARFCEVCRHDFQENKTGVAEAIVASQQGAKPGENNQQQVQKANNPSQASTNQLAQSSAVDNSHRTASQDSKSVTKDNPVIAQKLNVVISVDKDKVSASAVETDIKPDSVERVFPLDLDENLVGRRSAGKGIYPEIEINDPGVSRRHLKFIKQQDGSFAVLELGSANGTELNGETLEPGVNTAVKSGDELTMGIWTRLKIVSR